MPILLSQVLSVASVKDVTDLLKLLRKEHAIDWRPVDDNENNLATINLGSDPAAGVIERITNAIDAVIDAAWHENGCPADVKSPRAASAAWFNVPRGRLREIKDARDEVILDIVGKITVTFRDSERADRPTVDIRDLGTGISPDQFDETILSLHKSRKLKKLFLAGAFGQGGSTALAYSQYTLIVSRPSKWISDIDETGFTIVRFNPGDVNTDKHGVYEYLVGAQTSKPLVISHKDCDFEAGTLVRHISMDLGKYNRGITIPTDSPWWLTHNYLFDPVLPFTIAEDRNGKKVARTVTGNNRLLTHTDTLEYQRTAELTFREGTVEICWWVLKSDSDTARDRIKQYVQKSRPIVVTLNGQKQGDFPNTIIKNDLKLPYLDSYIIVHVNCDRVDNETRRHLFPTTRESVRDSSVGHELRELIVDTLRGDENLVHLDRERKKQLLSNADTGAVDKVRKRLATRVKNHVRLAGTGSGPSIVSPQPPGPPPNPPEPIPAVDPPSLLEFTSADPKAIYPGQRFTLAFRTDAASHYFGSPESLVVIPHPPEGIHYTGTASVKNGYGVLYFKADDDVEIGASFSVTMEIRPKRAPSLQCCTGVLVAPTPEKSGPDPGAGKAPNIETHWVHEGAPFWIDKQWTFNSVVDVVIGSDAIDVYLNADNKRLNGVLARAQRRDAVAVERIKDFYLEHLSFHAITAAFDAEKSLGALSDDQENIGEDRLDAEYSRACDTVCGIIEAVFEVIVTGANASE